MKLRRALIVPASLLAASMSASPAEEEIRAVFDRFVQAQNAHDAKAVEALLLDSPTFLWITRGMAVWGRGDAVRRFESLYAGTWHLAPASAELRVVTLGRDAAQLFVPIVFTIGAPGQPAQETRFLVNQVLVRTEAGWKVASILPIPVPAPAE